jgi:tetratricopeptide (TPR) repeat protein
MKLKKVILIGLLISGLAGCENAEQSANKYLENGKQLIESGDFVKARLEFKNALQIDPRLAEAYMQLALISEKEQEWAAMFSNLRAVVALRPNNTDAIVKLGQFYLFAGKLEDARAQADQALSLAPDSVDAVLLDASILLNSKNYADAMDRVDHALALDKQHVEAKSMKAIIWTRQGRVTDALNLIDETLETTTSSQQKVSLYAVKLSIYEKQKNFEGMEVIYKALLESDPANVKYVELLAQLFVIDGKPQQAVSLFENYISSYPDNIDVKYTLIALLSEIGEVDRALAKVDEFIINNPHVPNYRFSKAEILYKHNRIEESKAELVEIVKQDPESSTAVKANVILASYDFEDGNYEIAKDKVKQILQNEPESEGGLLLKSKLALVEDDVDAAIADLRILLRNNPDADNAMVLLAQAYNKIGAEKLAEENYRNALAINPGNVTAALAISQSLIQNNQLGEAETVLNKALATATAKQSIIKALTQINILQKDWSKAQELLDITSGVETDSTAWTHFITATIAEGQGYYIEAIDEYKKALSIEPNLFRALQGVVSSYIQLGKKDELLSYVETYGDNNPEKMITYELKARIYMSDQKWGDAITVLMDGVNKNPAWAPGYNQLAGVYFQQNQPEKAISILKQGIEANPTNLILKLQLASAYEQSSEFELAKGLYEEILQQAPDIQVAVNNLASLLTDQFESSENLVKAAEITKDLKSSTEPYFLDTYAWVRVKQGDLEEARPILERVVLAAPKVAIFHYHLATIYVLEGNKILAESSIAEAERLASQADDNVLLKQIDDLKLKLESNPS